MNLQQRTDEELSGFIFFGGLMNAELRRMTARSLVQHLHDPNYDALAEMQKLGLPEKFPAWWPAIELFITAKNLRNLTLHNEELAISLARHILNWCRKTFQRMNVLNEHGEEERNYRHWREHGEVESEERWQELIVELGHTYPELLRNWRFYEQRLSQDSSGSHPDRITQTREALQRNILIDWSSELKRKKYHFEETFLQEASATYFGGLKKKFHLLNQLGNLLVPYTGIMGKLWNASISDWNRIPWKKVQEYLKRLEDDPNLKTLAEILGRWQMTQLDLQEERLEKLDPKQNWKPNPYGKSEVIGIHHSDDLSAVLPSEIALLSQPETEIILSKKYVEKKLLSFQYRSQDFESNPEVKEEIIHQPKVEEQGPIILIIDTSGSMFGHPEQIAKAISFFLVSRAIQQDRKCYLISFSDVILTRELTGIHSNLEQLVDFLCLSFHGATDIQPAFQEALNILKEKDYHKADVLVISDFILPQVNPAMVEEVQTQRRDKGTQFHSLYITRRVKPEALPASTFDHFWVYDLSNPQVIRQTLEELERLNKS